MLIVPSRHLVLALGAVSSHSQEGKSKSCDFGAPEYATRVKTVSVGFVRLIAHSDLENRWFRIVWFHGFVLFAPRIDSPCLGTLYSTLRSSFIERGTNHVKEQLVVSEKSCSRS